MSRNIESGSIRPEQPEWRGDLIVNLAKLTGVKMSEDPSWNEIYSLMSQAYKQLFFDRFVFGKDQMDEKELEAQMWKRFNKERHLIIKQELYEQLGIDEARADEITALVNNEDPVDLAKRQKFTRVRNLLVKLGLK